MGDAIACALEQQRNFRSEDFAYFHPGGNLGRRLLTKVEDKMISINLPIVSPELKACDAIFEISKNKQGIAVVIENEEIVGAITDGDIRRTMQTNRESFFSIKVKDIMCAGRCHYSGKHCRKQAGVSECLLTQWRRT